jgi:Ca2+-binding EF-hand superfamily protein
MQHSMKFSILAFAAAILLVCSLSAVAQPPPQQMDRGGSQLLARLDTDHDGFVSKTEFGGPDSMFDKLDTNHDGKLSADELRGVRERDIMFAKADANNDGKVSLEEFLKYQQQMFTELDKDKNGSLSSDEFAAGLGGRGGQMGPGGQQGQWGDPAAMARMMLQRMDTNGDGKISPDEWRGPEGSFESADKNGDGYIDADELAQLRMGGPMRQGGPQWGGGQDHGGPGRRGD